MQRKDFAFTLAVFAALALGSQPSVQAKPTPALTAVTSSNWAQVTSPVFGTSETGTYAGAELFAGPNKFNDGNYFHGVIPNGRIVKPAGTSLQVGMNPLGAVLTPDGRYLITTNNDERDVGLASLQSPSNKGGYSLSVIDTATLQVISSIFENASTSTPKGFIGLQITGSGPYAVWASGGGDNKIYLYSISTDGQIAAATPASVAIAPTLPSTAGYVSNYVPNPVLNTKDANGNLPPAPSGFSRTTGAQTTFPAGSALSPDGRYLYVACNGDNSLAVIDTTSFAVVKQIAVGYFPYGVSVSKDGSKILVSNWGVTEYKFASPAYDGNGQLTSIGATAQNQPAGYFVPLTDTSGSNPKTSSLSFVSAPGGDGANASLAQSFYLGKPLDDLYQVGDTHPSATAIVRKGKIEVLYVAKANSDSLARILLNTNKVLPDFDLSPIRVKTSDGHKVTGSYPNALVASSDGTRLYVAEAGLNSVAVLDTTRPARPKLLGRIATGWYPTALALSPDDQTLYIVNAKGIGEDINPLTDFTTNPTATGVQSFSDSNFIFGTIQKVSLSGLTLDNTAVLGYNYGIHAPADTSIVPAGGKPSAKITHVIRILQENKTFDSMLGNLSVHFGPYSSLTYNNADGSTFTNGQYTGVSLNTQALAQTFAAAVNYYSDSEESDAGHQFAASGTSTDYTQKTLLVKTGRGLLVNKNFEPEDYPASGYIFNNAARNGVSFKDYGAMIRIEGTDTGTSTPTTLNDPPSGQVGYPQLQADNFTITQPVVNLGDVTSTTSGLGQSYFLNLPILAVLGEKNTSGEAHLDANYPGYNFNISDQRRAKEFIADFDRMVSAGTLPQYLYIYLPNDHTGSVQAPNATAVGSSGLQQIGDGDVALGQVVQHIMNSPVYYNAATGTGSAIFMTFDDAQSSLDHIHQHRTPLLVVSPYARPGYLGKQHYVTASIVKTEELLLGLPPNNLGDLFATDLRDLFQSTYNGITASQIAFNDSVKYQPTAEGERIWKLVDKLDTSAPDRDSRRLGRLTRLSMAADDLHARAAKENRLSEAAYLAAQARLYAQAEAVVAAPKVDDDD